MCSNKNKRFNISSLPLEGLKLIERKVIGDNRGFLTRVFCSEEFLLSGWDQSVAQINYTYTKKEVLLGACIFRLHLMRKKN